MIKHNLPITHANVAKFNVIADEFYKIRQDILKDLVLQLRTNQDDHRTTQKNVK